MFRVYVFLAFSALSNFSIVIFIADMIFVNEFGINLNTIIFFETLSRIGTAFWMMLLGKDKEDQVRHFFL